MNNDAAKTNALAGAGAGPSAWLMGGGGTRSGRTCSWWRFSACVTASEWRFAGDPGLLMPHCPLTATGVFLWLGGVQSSISFQADVVPYTVIPVTLQLWLRRQFHYICLFLGAYNSKTLPSWREFITLVLSSKLIYQDLAGLQIAEEQLPGTFPNCGFHQLRSLFSHSLEEFLSFKILPQ